MTTRYLAISLRDAIAAAPKRIAARCPVAWATLRTGLCQIAPGIDPDVWRPGARGGGRDLVRASRTACGWQTGCTLVEA